MPTETLALDGGTPIRSASLPAPYLGTSVYGREELDLLTEVIEKKLPFREYGDGMPHMVRDFEREARAYFDMPCALATATGSGSHYCAMAGVGVGPGDEVIIPSFGWYTDFEAPVLVGATPVFADIDRSLNMDPADFERKITPRTKAVIVVFFQGATNDMDAILRIARAHRILVIEDCAQACGATYKGRKIGGLGDVACFSFQQNKILSTGDGGLLLARDPVIFERAVRFHDLGFVRPSLKAQFGEEHVPEFAGCQFRMNEFTGAVALAQLRKLDSAILDVTRRHYRNLKKRVLEECPGLKLRPVGDADGDAGIAFFMDFGTPARAAEFAKALSAEGLRVGPSSGCCNLLHAALVRNKQQVHPALPPFGPGCPGESVRYSPELCPQTDDVVNSMVCVALAPKFTDADLDDIARGIIKVWRSGR
jgi:dTDP-4-amino-4,6-dideoxygalactose transaminase